MKLNKKVMITVSSVALATVLGFGIYHSNAAQAQPNLSQTEIEELVKAQYPGTITEVDLEKGFNKVVYEVEVESNGKEYEIKLDGNTGEVIKLEEKTIKNANQNSSNLTINEKDDTKDNTKDNTDDKSDDNADDKAKDKADDQSKDSNQKVVISTEEAKKIALAEFNGAIKELELDEDDDRLIYEIEIESSNGEAEIDIDAYTGEIIALSIDRDNTNSGNNKVTEDKKSTEKPTTNKPVNRDDDDDDDNDHDDDDDNDDDYNDDDDDNDDD